LSRYREADGAHQLVDVELGSSTREKVMRILSRCALGLAAAAAVTAPSARAAALAPVVTAPANIVIAVQNDHNGQERAGKDCTPYNGPFGFYGNVWCQPPNEMSYMRNLGSRWPMETPPSLKKPKPSSPDTDW